MRRITTVLAALALMFAVPGSARASNPASHDVTAPSHAGQHVHVDWTGIMPPGQNTGSCASAPLDDRHTINLTVPPHAYDGVIVTATFTMTPETGDGIITVTGPGGTGASADNAFVAAAETIRILNPKAGTWEVRVCPYAGAGPYTASLDMVSAQPGLCPPDLLAGLDLQTASIPQIQAKLQTGALTSRMLVDAYLKRIATYDPKLDSIRALNPHALEIADALDAERFASGPRSPMHGIPVLLKDNVGTLDMPTTAGSIALEGSIPLHEAMLVTKLRNAGAIILGKTNLSEFANWVDPQMMNGYSSLGGQVWNPYNFGDPSGSSSGSGVATAMAFSTTSIGTETSGSILSPSTANSAVGIKPTVGLVSRAGVIPLATSFDTAGPITRSVTDAAIMLGIISGADPRDAKTAENSGHIPAGSDYRPFLRADGLRGARIAVSDTEHDNLTAEEQARFDNVIATFEKLGATIVHTDALYAARNMGLLEFASIPNEFKYYLNKYLAEETPDTLRVRTLHEIMEYNNKHPDKLKYGQRWITISDVTLGNVDEPTAVASRTAAIQGAKTAIDTIMANDNIDAFLGPRADNANIGAAAQYPSIAVPAGYIGGGTTPFGITLLGTAYSEAKLIKFAYAFEHANNNRRVRPTLVNKGLCPAVKAQAKVLGTRKTARTRRTLPATGVECDISFALALLLLAAGAARVTSARR